MSNIILILIGSISAEASHRPDEAVDYDKLGASIVQEYCQSGHVTVADVADRTLFFFDDTGDFFRKWVERDEAAGTPPIGCIVKTARRAPVSYRNPFMVDERLRAGNFEVIQVITDSDGRSVPWLVFLRGRQLLRLSYSVDPE